MTGTQIRAIIEQCWSLERGMMQLSGMSVAYDLSRAIGSRTVRILVNGVALWAGTDVARATIEMISTTDAPNTETSR